MEILLISNFGLSRKIGEQLQRKQILALFCNLIILILG